MYRKGALKLSEKVTKEELAQALDNLVEKGQLNPALLHAELEHIKAEQRHKTALVMSQAHETETIEQAKRQIESEANANFELTPEQETLLISTLKSRFKKNQRRHKLFLWSRVEAKLNQVPAKKLWSLWQMEETGGEPDVVDYDKTTGEYIFFDCSNDSPTGRRNLCWDKEIEDNYRANYPEEKCFGNAVDLAAKMGIEILNEAQCRFLHELGEFDNYTESWIYKPSNQRNKHKGFFGGYNRSPTCRNGFHMGDTLGEFCHKRVGFRGSLRI